MKIVSIIGARPQFVKAAALSRHIRSNTNHKEILVHTGQHYDQNMSEIFFKQLDIPEPNYNLQVGSSTHGKQTGLMLQRIENVLVKEKPDWVIIFGDTNSTVAGALAAVKLHIKTAHIEAGLRSFNRKMPEEINRVASDHISDVLFPPTLNAANLLENEGLKDRSYFTGDIMYEVFLYYKEKSESKIKLEDIINETEFYLATVHRQENTDFPERLESIFSAFSKLDYPVILPLHPRTKKMINKKNISENIKIIDPVGYLEMLALLKNCRLVLTDSGGLQKEAFFMNKKCVTLRDETEWTETLNGNWNTITGADENRIIAAVKMIPFEEQKNYFGNGKTSEKIVEILEKLNKK